jgi:hypothetical protein
MKTKSISNKLIQSLFHSFPKIMKHLKLYHLLFLLSFTLFSSCNKEITEPEHKNNGSNVLYFEVDGKGYLLQDKRFGFKTKKTGEIFSGNDKKSLPIFRTIQKVGTVKNSISISYCFDKSQNGSALCGALFLEFKYINDKFNIEDIALSGLFYSPKLDKVVDFYNLSNVLSPELTIFNFDKNAEIISGQLRFNYFEKTPDETVSVYIYFDIPVSNAQ